MNNITEDKVFVRGLEKYSNHLQLLLDHGYAENPDLHTSAQGEFFIQGLLFADGIVSTQLHEFNIQLPDDYAITHEEYVEVMLAHAKMLNDIRETNEEGTVESVLLKFSYDLAIEQAKAIAQYAAKEFETLQNIEERGVVEVESVPLVNADSLIEEQQEQPTNEAKRLLRDIYNIGQRTSTIQFDDVDSEELISPKNDIENI